MEKVSFSEAARLAGIHPNTIRNWRKAGKLKTTEKVLEKGIEIWIVDPGEITQLALLAHPSQDTNNNNPVNTPNIEIGSLESSQAAGFEQSLLFMRESVVKPLTDLVERQSNQIKEMSEELGSLKEHIRQLEAKQAETPTPQPVQAPALMLEPSPILNKETLQPEPPKKKRHWWQF